MSTNKYKVALEELVKKIEEVENNDSFKGLFTVAYVRGIQYSGPSWDKEMMYAKKVIKDGYTASSKDIDLFDVKKVDIFKKIDEAFAKIRAGMTDKVIVEDLGHGHFTVKIVELAEQPLKDENDA